MCKYIFSKVRFFHLIALLVTLFASNIYADDVKVRKYQSRAQTNVDWSSGGKKQLLEFKYANAKASLRQNGDILIEGDIKHKGLLCGTYSGGVRFGKGSRGCSDVKWITEPVYLTTRKQCNNVALPHTGGGVDPLAAEKFSEITCGQFLVKCSGNCK